MLSCGPHLDTDGVACLCQIQEWPPQLGRRARSREGGQDCIKIYLNIRGELHGTGEGLTVESIHRVAIHGDAEVGAQSGCDHLWIELLLGQSADNLE